MLLSIHETDRVGEAEKEGMELGSHRGQVEAAPIPTVFDDSGFDQRDSISLLFYQLVQLRSTI